jgi:hypothetical protein
MNSKNSNYVAGDCGYLTFRLQELNAPIDDPTIGHQVHCSKMLQRSTTLIMLVARG